MTNRHKQVLAIARKILGAGGHMYSEANTHTRRLKYCYIETGGKQITQSELRRALDGAGLNEVVVKDFYCSDYYAGATLLEPIAWFTE